MSIDEIEILAGLMNEAVAWEKSCQSQLATDADQEYIDSDAWYPLDDMARSIVLRLAEIAK